MSTVAVQQGDKSTAPAAVSIAFAQTVVLPDHHILIPPAAHTLAGFRAWARSADFPQRGRISFLGEEIFIDMSPEELETHGKIKTETGYVLVGINKRRKLGEFYSDRTLLTNPKVHLSTEPDATFATWESLETRRIRLVPREGVKGQYLELEGTPDWVLEIISDSSVRKDTARLRDQYFRAGIPEYWLIDARGETIDFQILVAGEQGYVPQPVRNGWQLSPLFGRRFRLVRRRGRLNHWQYTLQVKPR